MDPETTPLPPARIARSKSRSRIRLHSAARRDYAIGILLLLVVVVLWTSSNFVTQDLFEDGYEKPFLVTYLNTSAFSLYLLPYVIRRYYVKSDEKRGRRGPHEGYEPLLTDADAAETLGATIIESDVVDDPRLKPLTTEETAHLAALFCFLWFIANWSVNASLDYTSVASATILSSMSGFFTLGIGRIFRVESLTVVKIAAVITSFVGVVLVSLSDSSQPALSDTPSPTSMSQSPSTLVIGDALALFSALFYALYVTLLKVRIRSEERIDMQVFFGFVGLFNILACWPIGVILHLTGVEPFQLPSSSKAVMALLTNMAITLSSDYIYVIAMLKTTPLVVTVGLSLTMPLAVLGDFVLGRPAKAQVMLGAAVVIFSFLALGFEDSRNEDLLDGAPLDAEANGTDVYLEDEVPLSS
ncbi:hypothetical protein BN946_scf184868.g26 [Trametes cinnabarina]|uniref:Uncharacterized protein n=1 Tax=Pycnoporus cinnabarinus TaxID=5643 RepID=A0A060SPY5_PYCCI|nr:hypothetical protein BN946_scf184868.g26 [Trametes cinnabarina]